jgi:hypothetical protein
LQIGIFPNQVLAMASQWLNPKDLKRKRVEEKREVKEEEKEEEEDSFLVNTLKRMKKDEKAQEVC